MHQEAHEDLVITAVQTSLPWYVSQRDL